MGAMSLVSDNVRTALFGMERLNKNMEQTKGALDKVSAELLKTRDEYKEAYKDLFTSKEEIAALKSEQEDLKNESDKLKSDNAELEKNKRGIYGGAIGYLSFQGDLDTCIAIRLAYRKHNTVFIRSGAGIVADSVPEKEYQECINKAAAVVRALKEAEELDV